MLTDFWPARFEDRLHSEQRRPLSHREGSFFRPYSGFSGRSAVSAGRRYHGLEHVKRLHANLAVGSVIGGNVQDVSRTKLLALPIDVESHTVVRRGADQPDGKAPPAHD